MLKNAATRLWERLQAPRPRWFGHPTVIAVLIGLLITDYISIPGGRWRGGSTVKTTIEHLTGRWSGVLINFASFPGMFVQDGDEIELVWHTNDPIPGHVILADYVQPSNRVSATWKFLGWPDWRINERRGFYHITRRQTSHGLPSRLTREQTSRMMELFIERSDSIPPTHELAHYSADFANMRRIYDQGKTSERTPIPIGYYRNAIALTLLAMLILAFAKGRTDLWLKSWLARVLNCRQPWQCTNCGYDVRGLTQCPECGTTLERDR